MTLQDKRLSSLKASNISEEVFSRNDNFISSHQRKGLFASFEFSLAHGPRGSRLRTSLCRDGIEQGEIPNRVEDVLLSALTRDDIFVPFLLR